MTQSKQVLGPDDVRRAVTRMAHEIIERNHGLEGVALVGLQRGGVWLAEALGTEIARIERSVPVGSIDAALYRDDIGLRPVLSGFGRARSRSRSTAARWCSSTTCSTPAAP